MLRDLTMDEMEMVSGGEDEVISTGTRNSSNGSTLAEWQVQQLYGVGGEAYGSTNWADAVSNLGGYGAEYTPPVTPTAEVQPDCHGHNMAQNTINGTGGVMHEMTVVGDGPLGRGALIATGIGVYVVGTTHILARAVDGGAHIAGLHEGCY